MSETDKIIESMRCMLRDMKYGGYLVSAETTEQGIAEIERLQAIVDLLPKDAEGNPLFVGMRRWVVDEDSRGLFQGWETIKQIHRTNEGWHVACETCDTSPECCWSSMEAAEQARNQPNG